MQTDEPVELQEVVGDSEWSHAVRAEINRIAPHKSTVLITGPSGTGKDLIARTIHALSGRRGKPFVPVDCAGISEGLLASQLFGHVKGAFTGATCSTLGCFRAAEGGTLFLDELGELQPSLQAKLLRMLQERAVVPVGSYEPIPVDVRIIAATNRDLKQLVAAGTFREDLYYRLAVFPLEVAALKHRREDIAPLAEHLLHELWRDGGLPRAELAGSALAEFEAFDWPGNIRQLRHVLEQAVISATDRTITGDLIGQILREARLPAAAAVGPLTGPLRLPAPARPVPEARWPTLDELQRRHIERTLQMTHDNLSAAARKLGVSRQALHRKIEKYGITIHHMR